jgi:nucleotide-binding universal stress UspA family protein
MNIWHPEKVPCLYGMGRGSERLDWSRPARAAGPPLGQAEPGSNGLVEVLCVTPDAAKSIAGADLAAHLARHCKQVTLTELPKQHGDIARTLRAHVEMAKADLLVMGAYAHPRVLEMVMGGVTRDMLAEAEVPLFLSY